jgi:hypothetical protein
MNNISRIKKSIIYTICLIAIFSSANSTTITPKSWTTTTINNAYSSVTEANISLRVYKESWASAKTNLGSLDGTLNISFTYNTSSLEGWWEIPVISIADGRYSSFSLQQCGKTDNFDDSSVCGNIFARPINNITMKEYGTTSGIVNEFINVTGNIDLIFALVPSSWYWNGDHFNTYFNASNININYKPRNDNIQPVPVPSTSLLFSSALAFLAGIKRIRIKTL